MQNRDLQTIVNNQLDLLNKLAPENILTRQEVQRFIERFQLQSEVIPQKITDFLNKLSTMGTMKAEDFTEFQTELSKIDYQGLHDLILGLVNMTARVIYDVHTAQIDKSTSEIEAAINSNSPIPKNNASISAFGLMNVYILGNIQPTLNLKAYYGHAFPGRVLHETIVQNLTPLGINALKLTGRIPDTGVYCNIDMSKPIYPRAKLMALSQEYEPVVDKPGKEMRGVKKAAEYFPFKPASKLAKGDTGDNTYMATNGKKILYVRSLKQYAPNAVLASKIASFISPSNFASERVLSNRLTGARKHSGYEAAFNDSNIRAARDDYIKNQKRAFPGTGIIDEVLNFVNEQDINIENFGFSNKKNISESHVVKIDYDLCSVDSPLDKKEYEKDILSKRTIYKNNDHQNTPDYIAEKIYTRLKLSLLPIELISGLANKAYIDDAKLAKKAASELARRTEMAFDLLMDKKNIKNLKDVLTKDPTLLHQIYTEAHTYINAHFDQPNRDLILKAYDKKYNSLCKNIISKCNLKEIINLDNPDVAIAAELVEKEKVVPQQPAASAPMAPSKPVIEVQRAPEPPKIIPAVPRSQVQPEPQQPIPKQPISGSPVAHSPTSLSQLIFAKAQPQKDFKNFSVLESLTVLKEAVIANPRLNNCWLLRDSSQQGQLAAEMLKKVDPQIFSRDQKSVLMSQREIKIENKKYYQFGSEVYEQISMRIGVKANSECVNFANLTMEEARGFTDNNPPNVPIDAVKVLASINKLMTDDGISIANQIKPKASGHLPSSESRFSASFEEKQQNAPVQPIENIPQKPIREITINGKMYPELENPMDKISTESNEYVTTMCGGINPLLPTAKIDELKAFSVQGVTAPIKGKEEYIKASLYAAKAVAITTLARPQQQQRVINSTESMQLFLRTLGMNPPKETQREILHWAVGIASMGLVLSGNSRTSSQIELAIQIASRARAFQTSGLDMLETKIHDYIKDMKPDDKKALEAKFKSALPKQGISSFSNISGGYSHNQSAFFQSPSPSKVAHAPILETDAFAAKRKP